MELIENERLVCMSKVKKAHTPRKPQNGVNKKAIVWTSSIVAAFLIVVIVLMIVFPS